MKGWIARRGQGLMTGILSKVESRRSGREISYVEDEQGLLLKYWRSEDPAWILRHDNLSPCQLLRLVPTLNSLDAARAMLRHPNCTSRVRDAVEEWEALWRLGGVPSRSRG